MDLMHISRIIAHIVQSDSQIPLIKQKFVKFYLGHSQDKNGFLWLIKIRKCVSCQATLSTKTPMHSLPEQHSTIIHILVAQQSLSLTWRTSHISLMSNNHRMYKCDLVFFCVNVKIHTTIFLEHVWWNGGIKSKNEQSVDYKHEI